MSNKILAFATAAVLSTTVSLTQAAPPTSPVSRTASPAPATPFVDPLRGSSTAISNPLSYTRTRPAAPIRPPVVQPVPEPSQWALMIAGLGLVGYMVSRRRRNP